MSDLVVHRINGKPVVAFAAIFQHSPLILLATESSGIDNIHPLQHKGAVSAWKPICSTCKIMRDNQGAWKQMEEYVESCSDVAFSHSICPGCAKEHYPDMNLYDE